MILNPNDWNMKNVIRKGFHGIKRFDKENCNRVTPVLYNIRLLLIQKLNICTYII